MLAARRDFTRTRVLMMQRDAAAIKEAIAAKRQHALRVCRWRQAACVRFSRQCQQRYAENATMMRRLSRARGKYYAARERDRHACAAKMPREVR